MIKFIFLLILSGLISFAGMAFVLLDVSWLIEPDRVEPRFVFIFVWPLVLIFLGIFDATNN